MSSPVPPTPTPTPTPTPPTQLRHPWRTLTRSLFQLLVSSLAVAVPDGLGADAPYQAQAVIMAVLYGIVVRVMAIPRVDAWATEYLGLGAEPRRP